MTVHVDFLLGATIGRLSIKARSLRHAGTTLFEGNCVTLLVPSLWAWEHDSPLPQLTESISEYHLSTRQPAEALERKVHNMPPADDQLPRSKRPSARAEMKRGAKPSSSTRRTVRDTVLSKTKGKKGYAFEMIVLGSGGGPLETDCSGYEDSLWAPALPNQRVRYLLKPILDRWEDGIMALEGGESRSLLSLASG